MRLLKKLILAIVLVAGAAYAYAWRSSIAPIDRPPATTFDAAAIKAGASLAAIGNCTSCHTRDGGPSFAGGRPIETPFGTIHATNITPDPITGIGRWPEAAFTRAVREGVSRDGRHLYPAFPYDHMTKTSDADIKAVYAFLMTRQPVTTRATANNLAFPYSMRSLLAGWKLVYFDRSPFKSNPAKSAEWNRGAYLVEGLAHCGSCHTPRNAYGAEDKSRAYAGAEVSGWTAPALGPTSPAPLPWAADTLAAYLAKGRAPRYGAANGPMGPVLQNLAAVPQADIVAMATYVASISGAPSPERSQAASRAFSRAAGAPATRSPPAGNGAAIYAGACAQCHGEAGRSPINRAHNLALSTSVRAEAPNNLARIVLGGIQQAGNRPGPYMPGFANALSDAQLTDLIQFVRTSFTEQPAFAGVDTAIRNAR